MSCLAQPAPDPVVESDSTPSPPHFSVMPRQDELTFYPCADCHEYLDPDSEIRVLDPDPGHPDVLEHGAGEVWCTSCHGPWPYNQLHTLLGKPATFDESYRICGGCHQHKLRDWKYGAHGKRVDNWRGERLLYGCPECHNPHSPAIAPRKPMPPPTPRAGLERFEGHAEREPRLWELPQKESDHE